MPEMAEPIEQGRADGRGQQADAKVQHHDDAQMDGDRPSCIQME